MEDFKMLFPAIWFVFLQGASKFDRKFQSAHLDLSSQSEPEFPPQIIGQAKTLTVTQIRCVVHFSSNMTSVANTDKKIATITFLMNL